MSSLLQRHRPPHPARPAQGLRRRLHRHGLPFDRLRSLLMHPYYAAERGLVDDVIDPAETRIPLIDALAVLRTKHVSQRSRKHGSQPQ